MESRMTSPVFTTPNPSTYKNSTKLSLNIYPCHQECPVAPTTTPSHHQATPEWSTHPQQNAMRRWSPDHSVHSPLLSTLQHWDVQVSENKQSSQQKCPSLSEQPENLEWTKAEDPGVPKSILWIPVCMAPDPVSKPLTHSAPLPVRSASLFSA